jgi:hypothetical protein
VFAQNSRYATAGTYTVTLPDGRVATVTRIPLPQQPPTLGWHRRAEAERLDLIAYQYLRDATRAWTLGWSNGAVVLDALAAHELIAIPRAR